MMSSFNQEPRNRSAEQARAIEEMQMRHARILRECGVAKKTMMHIVERQGSRPIEDMLHTGLPLIIESTHELMSVLYAGIRFTVDGSIIKTKIVPVGHKDVGDSHYQPYAMSRFDNNDCLIVERLLEEARAVNETLAPGYSLELGMLHE